LIAAAIQAADSFVDYAAFDLDRDGAIEPEELHITVIAAGGEASTRCAAPSVWAHQWSMPAPPVVDGVRPSTYTVFGEQQCSSGAPRPATIGVIAHELGHDLGWPDEYDTDSSSQSTSAGGVGAWSLMSYGAHNRTEGGLSGSSPAHPDAFLKAYQGWLTPVELRGSRQSVMFDASTRAPTVVQLLANPNGIDWSMNRASGAGEYFLVENRQRAGYDRGLPGCGIVVWKIDESRDFYRPNDDDLRRMVQLLGADGNDRYFDATDAWRGPMVLDDDSFPSSGLYSGARSGVSLSRFSASCSQRMQADLSDGTAG
jgi:M6 family metalloprotease-like protein